MFELIINEFHALVKTIAGPTAITQGFVTVWLLGIATWTLRKVPVHLYQVVKKNIIISTTIDRAEEGDRVKGRLIERFITRYSTLPCAKYDNNLRTTVARNGKVTQKAGYGYHWMIYEGRFYWFHHVLKDSTGVGFQRQRLTVYTFGRTREVLSDLMVEFTREMDDNRFTVRTCKSRGTTTSETVEIDETPVPVYDTFIRENIVDRVIDFIGHEQWYRERDIAFKHTILIHGKPGTGKTAIARLLAIKTGWDIHNVAYNTMDDESFADAFNYIPAKTIMLLDDIDDISGATDRGKTNGQLGKGPSLSALLGVLDGVCRLDEVIVLMTTNYLDRIDPAVYRPGRVDTLVEFGDLSEEFIKLYVDRIYSVDSSLPYKSITMAELAGLVNIHKMDYDGFLKSYNAK